MRGRALRELAAGLEVGGHVIEGAHQVTHLAVCNGGHAMVVFAGGDLVHGHAQRLNRPGDLLGEKHGQPQAGKEDEDRNEQLH